MQYLSNFFASATTETFAAARETRGKLHFVAKNEHFKSVGGKNCLKVCGRHRNTESGGNKTVRLTFQSCALAAARLIKIFPPTFVKLIFHGEKKNRRVTAESSGPRPRSFFLFHSLFFGSQNFFGHQISFFFSSFFLRKFNARIKARALS